MNQYNIEITYALLFNSLYSNGIGTGIQHVLTNIKGWVDFVYKIKYPHEFKDVDCTIFNKIKRYQPTGK